MRGTILIVSLLLLLAACSPIVGAPTPEALTQQVVEHIGSSAGVIHLHGVRPAPQGRVVLYSQQTRDEEGLPSYWGYVLAEQNGNSWFATSSSWGRGPSRGLINYRVETIPGVSGDDLLVYGRATSPEVATVEARMDTGQILRDAPTAMFAIIVPDANAVCDLRALDAQGKILQEIDLLDPDWSPPMPEAALQQAQQKCRR